MGAGSEAETGGGGGGFTDAFFGIGIVNPLVGSTALEQRMEGRRRVRLSQMRSAMRGGDIDGDWVTMAVVVFKGEPRNSQNVTTSSISFLFFFQVLPNRIWLFSSETCFTESLPSLT